MNCPSVLMIPFGPAPYRKMLTVPKIKPMMTPTLPPIIAPILTVPCKLARCMTIRRIGRGTEVIRTLVNGRRAGHAMLRWWRHLCDMIYCSFEVSARSFELFSRTDFSRLAEGKML